MVWSDREIREWARYNVFPFNDLHVNPGSLDLTLGNTMRLPMWYWRNPVTRWLAWKLEVAGYVPENYVDKSEFDRNQVRRFQRWSDEFQFQHFTLWPGEFILCCSAEYTILPDAAIATLYSKSSIGRIGLEHLHAGYGDQGFQGQWTWELFNAAPWPIELVAGRRYMQIVLSTAHLPEKPYGATGRYQGQTGATPSR